MDIKNIEVVSVKHAMLDTSIGRFRVWQTGKVEVWYDYNGEWDSYDWWNMNFNEIQELGLSAIEES